jgi:aminopeptidase-like protein
MNVLSFQKPDFGEYPYIKRGSDERQYQAPGVDIPLVCFCRSKYHIYPEYHTSADDLSLISPEGLAGSYDVMVQCIKAIENNAIYRVNCLCEPQLGKRGLMPTISSKETYQDTLALKDVVAYADGRNDIIELSNIIEQPVYRITNVINKLVTAGLLDKISE